MAMHSVRVRKAQLPEHKDLIDRPEHCSATAALLEAIGRDVGQQIRIRRVEADSQFALYTVADMRNEGAGNDDMVRLGQEGRERLGTAGAFDDGEVDADCVSTSRWVDTGAEVCPLPGMWTAEEIAAMVQGELIELVCHDRVNTGLIVIAPHGRLIEEHTDDQAKHVVATLADTGECASLWQCQGWGGGTGSLRRWHITSTEINAESIPGLRAICMAPCPFTHAVSFHGYERRSADDRHVCIGGSASSALQEAMRAAIAAVLPETMVVEVYDGGSPRSRCARFSGSAMSNIVNRLGAHGVQIEQSWEARDDHWREIAEAVAGVYARQPAGH